MSLVADVAESDESQTCGRGQKSALGTPKTCQEKTYSGGRDILAAAPSTPVGSHQHALFNIELMKAK
jgi:hypothetical protein